MNNYAKYNRFIFVKDNTVSYKNLNHYSVGYKFYGYQANGVRIFTSAYVAKANNSYYKSIGVHLESLFQNG